MAINGLDKLQAKLSALPGQLDKAAQGALYLGGLQIEALAKQSIMEGGKSGIVYKRRGVSHTASAPGETPANDTGRLVNSIHTDRSDDGQTVTVSVDAAYGAPLEFGSVHMAARPFMLPALRKATPDIEKSVGMAIKEVIGK